MLGAKDVDYGFLRPVFLHQLSLVLLCLGEECLVVFRVGVEGAVVQGGFYWSPFLQEGVRVVGEESVGEALVDVLHGLVGGMEHVLTIEAIVAQFVVYDFVCVEIRQLAGMVRGRILLHQLVRSQQ